VLKGLPILLIPNAVPEAAQVEEFVRELNEKWAAFEGKPLIQMESEELPKLHYRRFSEDAEGTTGPLTRQD
jgi:hypothetical protein